MKYIDILDNLSLLNDHTFWRLATQKIKPNHTNALHHLQAHQILHEVYQYVLTDLPLCQKEIHNMGISI
jgi:hypothetical protein